MIRKTSRSLLAAGSTTRAVLRVALACNVLLLGCAHFGPGIPGTACPVAWVPSEAIPARAANLRVRMQLQIRDRDVHLELIAEPKLDELVVVGLARFGVRLFAVHQRGREVEIAGAASKDLEQVAVWALDALHRVFWIEAPDVASERAWARAGESVSERTTPDGRRRIFALGGDSKAAGSALSSRVTIDYPLPSADLEGTGHSVSIRNPWCGYEALIVPVRRPATSTRSRD